MALRSILKTYEGERQKNMCDLIDFDHRFSRLFSGRSVVNVTNDVRMEEFKETFKKGNLFTSGIAVDYDRSILLAKAPVTRAINGGFDDGEGEGVAV